MKVHIAFPGTLGVLLRLAQELEDSLLPVGGGTVRYLERPLSCPVRKRARGTPDTDVGNRELVCSVELCLLTPGQRF